MDVYVGISEALLSAQADPAALRSVLSGLPDGGKGWIEAAYTELRKELVLGRLQEAETISNLIEQVLNLQEDSATDELTPGRLHQESMTWINDGIRAILALDNVLGIFTLQRMTEAVYGEHELQWVAWYWTSAAALNEGDLELAGRAAEQAMELGRELDLHARGLSLCRLGEIEFSLGRHEAALGDLAGAHESFESIGELRGMAMAALSRAKILMQLGREEEAIDAAATAYEADPEWEAPVLFISQWLVTRGMLGEAEDELCSLYHLSPRSPKVERHRLLLEGIRQGSVPMEAAAEYLQLKEQRPTVENVKRLEVLWKEHPDFIQLRELLAWTLAKTGSELEAVWHFNAMADLDLSSEVQASVLLGLGCLANRRFKNRQPVARVRAAASAVPERVAAPDPGGDQASAAAGSVGNEEHTKKLEGVRAALESSFAFSAEAEDEVKQQPRRALRKHMASFEPKAVFNGDLKLFSVLDLLDFLYSSRRTGTLVVTSKAGIGAVCLHEGRITGAATPISSNLGDLLREENLLTEEQLQHVVDRQSSVTPGRLLGSLLLEEELVDEAVLKELLTRQIKIALLELVTWTRGRFAFEPDSPEELQIPMELELELDTRALLLDVLREFDEQNR